MAQFSPPYAKAFDKDGIIPVSALPGQHIYGK